MALPNTDDNSKQTNDPPAVLDRIGFAAQYRIAYPRLALIAVGIIGDKTHAEDIVQEAAVIALQKIEEFSPGSSFAAWMSAIVRRCSLNYARKMKGRATFATDPRSLDRSKTDQKANENLLPVSERGALVDDQVAFDDQVIRALGRIAEDARCCLLLRTVLGLSYAEISEMLGIPKGTAMSHVHRSKSTLRQLLSEKKAWRAV